MMSEDDHGRRGRAWLPLDEAVATGRRARSGGDRGAGVERGVHDGEGRAGERGADADVDVRVRGADGAHSVSFLE